MWLSKIVAEQLSRGVPVDRVEIPQKLLELKLIYAQAQSDKIELMRDIATYEFNLCEGLSFKEQMTQMRDYIADYRDQIKSLGVESDMF